MSSIQLNLIDRVIPRSKMSDVSLVVSAALLTAIAAQVQIPMYPVPMTLQTLAVLLFAAALGPWRAVSAMTLYVGMGAVGLPVFAGAKALGQVLPTAGYLFGFVVAALVVGYLAQLGFAKKSLNVAISFLVGSTLIYFFGAGWLVVGLGMTPAAAFMAGVAPFLVGDAVKAIVAATLLPAAWRLVR
jgi:biotin transport system substrate-specific component